MVIRTGTSSSSASAEVRLKSGVVRRHTGELRGDLSETREMPGGIPFPEHFRTRSARLQYERRSNETIWRGGYPLLDDRGSTPLRKALTML